MSSAVPEGWALEPFGKYIAESAAGEWGKEAAGNDNDIPVLRSTNFTASGIIDYSKLAIRNIEEKKRVKKGLVSGDVVLEKSGGSPTQPVGRVVYFENDKPFLFSNFTQRLSPSTDCDSKYLFYVLYKAYQDGIVNKFQQQTTGIINFQLAEYLLYKTPFPPLPEQKKIASILTSVDEVIEKTESQIAKLQDLKTGMMQELLTKGIGHTEFKDSPVGRIPVVWDVVKFDDIANSITCGVAATPTYVEPNEGVPFLSAQNVSNGKVVLKKYRHITHELHRKLTRNTKPQKGDILYSRVGANYGEAAVVEIDWDFSVYVSLTLIKLSKKCDRYFIKYLLNSRCGKLQAKNGVFAGGGVPNLNVAVVKAFDLPLPSLEEQVSIATTIQSIDSRISTKKDALNSLRNVKKALMQDLLTGKVRVQAD